MCQCVQTILREVCETRQADNGSVDTTKCGESKDFGSIIPADENISTRYIGYRGWRKLTT
jgi:hypothetical protein